MSSILLLYLLDLESVNKFFYYVSSAGGAHVCMLDASKAFDRVNLLNYRCLENCITVACALCHQNFSTLSKNCNPPEKKFNYPSPPENISTPPEKISNSSKYLKPIRKNLNPSRKNVKILPKKFQPHPKKSQPQPKNFQTPLKKSQLLAEKSQTLARKSHPFAKNSHPFPLKNIFQPHSKKSQPLPKTSQSLPKKSHVLLMLVITKQLSSLVYSICLIVVVSCMFQSFCWSPCYCWGRYPVLVFPWRGLMMATLFPLVKILAGVA